MSNDFLSEEQIAILKSFGDDILKECIESLEVLDWAIKQDDSGITEYDIEDQFVYYRELGRERYGDKN